MRRHGIILLRRMKRVSGVHRNVILLLGNHCLPVSVSSSIWITHMCFTNQPYDTMLGYTVSGKTLRVNETINWTFPLSDYDDTSYLTRSQTSATQQSEPKNLQDLKPVKATLCFSCLRIGNLISGIKAKFLNWGFSFFLAMLCWREYLDLQRRKC